MKHTRGPHRQEQVPAPDRQQPLLAQQQDRRDGYNEERSNGQRARKIFHRHTSDPTCVRCPSPGPLRSINMTFLQADDRAQVREILAGARRAIVDDREKNHFPSARVDDG